MTWDERGRLWVCETYDYPNELQPDRRRPRPHPHLRRHRRRRPGRQVHRLCREAEHPDDDRLLSRRGDRPERRRDDLPEGHQRRRRGRPEENARHRLEHARHARRGEQFSLWPRQLVLRHAGLQRLAARADQRQAGPALPPGLLPLQGRRRRTKTSPSPSSNSSARRTTTPGAWESAKKGIIFGSTANGNPSEYMPIPNRYYEAVRGWSSSGLTGIADSNRFYPDHRKRAAGRLARRLHGRRRPRPLHGPQLSAANTGTAPPSSPSRRGTLIATFVLRQQGAGFQSKNSWNLVASDDEWTAPIQAEVGPDGNVWFIDWYNFIVQHNPTPQGFARAREPPTKPSCATKSTAASIGS